MEMSKGDIVQSLNGRDKGKALYVAGVDGEYVILVDGKSRRLEHPKRKKQKHCMFLTSDGYRLSEKLRADEHVTNSEVRRALATFNAGAEEQSENETEPGGG